jgi:riboflavin synthase
MFTGLIEEVGEIIGITKIGLKRYFDIKCYKIPKDIKIGSSVACDGICLTVIQKNDDSIKVEAMNETLFKTTAKFWDISTKINLERAVKANQRLEGHYVLGHVDTVGQINSKTFINDTLYLEFIVDEKFYPLIVPQGSIAINGVSLTIAKLKDYSFMVALIGHTIENSNLRLAKEYVNIEFDVIGKYVRRNMEFYETEEDDDEIDQDWLRDNGF